MLEKLFARLRSRRQGDLAALPVTAPILSRSTATSTGTGALAAAGAAINALAGDDAKAPATDGTSTLAATHTPPPLPADAWAESESGIVISDSGIIILEPPSTPRRPSIPALAPASPPAAKRALTPGELDWDDVLARARARAEIATEPSPIERSPSRAKAK